MKLRFLSLILFVTVITSVALSQQPPQPLTKGQVMDLVKYGVSGADLAQKIKNLGIDFEPTDDYLQALRNAGAQDAVIQALHAARPKALTREQVGKLVAGGVPGERAAMLVKQRGIDFLADDEYLRTLRLSGADDTLIAAVREASAAARVATLAPSPGQIRENPKDRLKYVWIPHATFVMGCTPGDNECEGAEKPSHEVSISKGFWIGQTVVTVGAYKRFAASTGRQMPENPDFYRGWANDNMPIVNLSWDEARNYCTWAGGRLPSEAEWEYAARGGSAGARYGSIDEVAWYSENSKNHVHPVGEKRANGFGLYDMLGNVWEWVNDWYDEKYYQSSPSQDPAGPAKGQVMGFIGFERGETHVLRGGAFFQGDNIVRVSSRMSGITPAYRAEDVGFRCGGELFAP